MCGLAQQLCFRQSALGVEVRRRGANGFSSDLVLAANVVGVSRRSAGRGP